MGKVFLFLCFLLSACVSSWVMPSDFVYEIIGAGDYDLVTYQRIFDNTSPIHIYIEGDGAAFDVHGRPTSDPTPTGTLMRELAARDTSANVVYMARPCQYVMSSSCNQTDWTDGRFSRKIIDSVASAIIAIAGNRPVVLIGYSGGALLSGLIIDNYPSINVRKWVTIAGVLNHSDWSGYFGDLPLLHSMNLYALPHIPQIHYIADGDTVVPNDLSHKWVSDKNLRIVPNSSHSDFPNLNIDF